MDIHSLLFFLCKLFHDAQFSLTIALTAPLSATFTAKLTDNKTSFCHFDRDKVAIKRASENLFSIIASESKFAEGKATRNL